MHHRAGAEIGCPHLLMAIISLPLDGDLQIEIETLPELLRGNEKIKPGKLSKNVGGGLAMSDFCLS